MDLILERVSPSWTHFQGVHLRTPYLDPLQVWPMEEVWGEYEDAIEYNKERQSGEKFSYNFTFSSDPETKAGFGGGLLLSMELPDVAHDTTIYFEDTDTKEMFVSYLRRSLRWGGFPGFADVDPHKRPQDLIELARGLLPI